MPGAPIGRPNIPATWPQMMLPSVIAPNMTVTKTARPRARTQSGSATCADTLRLRQDGDPCDARSEACNERDATGSRQDAKRRSASAVPTAPTAVRRSGPSQALQSRQRERAACTAPGADRAEENAVELLALRRPGRARSAARAPNTRLRTGKSSPPAPRSHAAAGFHARSAARRGWRCRSVRQASAAAVGCAAAATRAAPGSRRRSSQH